MNTHSLGCAGQAALPDAPENEVLQNMHEGMIGGSCKGDAVLSVL